MKNTYNKVSKQTGQKGVNVYKSRFKKQYFIDRGLLGISRLN
jgi:hypothetical protein